MNTHSQNIYQDRFNATFKLCQNLLENKFKSLGKTAENINRSLIESVIAHPKIVELIQTTDFSLVKYKTALLLAIEETRKELFPELAKKRFVSLNQIELLDNPIEALIETENRNKNNKRNRSLLLKKDVKYLTKFVVKKEKLLELTSVIKYQDKEKIKSRLIVIKKLFPTGLSKFEEKTDHQKKLSAEDIQAIYKCILAGINKKFPKNFLKYDAEYRCKILTIFLFEDILQLKTSLQLDKLRQDVFYKYKLQNVLRYFNYSVKNVINNAYPNKFPGWLYGKIDTNFWQKRKNRITAIRWLVEEKLKIDLYTLGKIQINKQEFTKNGLSYLYNSHYNSVYKALLEGYPFVRPWQIKTLKQSYWTPEAIKEAIRWMVNKLGWDYTLLPLKYNSGELNRKKFANFGLSGLLEKKFSANVYRAISFAYPGKFHDWQFNLLSTQFWDLSSNIVSFVEWTLTIEEISKMFQTGNWQGLNTVIQKYYFYNSLKRKFQDDTIKPYRIYLTIKTENQKMIRLNKKWELLIKAETQENSLNFLLFGLFYWLTKAIKNQSIDHYKRMQRRRYRLISAL